MAVIGPALHGIVRTGLGTNLAQPHPWRFAWLSESPAQPPGRIVYEFRIQLLRSSHVANRLQFANCTSVGPRRHINTTTHSDTHWPGPNVDSKHFLIYKLYGASSNCLFWVITTSTVRPSAFQTTKNLEMLKLDRMRIGVAE